MSNKLFSTTRFKIFLGLIIMLSNFVFVHQVMAATNKYAPGSTIIMGEFVYDDNGNATTSDCMISIYDDTSGVHNAIASNITMSTSSNSDGWHYYSTTTLTTEGLYPATMTCGSFATGDVAILDKTFVIGYDNASTTAISDAVWNNSASSSVATVINAHTDSAILTASTSLAANVNTNTNTQIQTASSSIVSQIISSLAGLPASIWTYFTETSRLATEVWGATTRKLTSALLGTGSDSLTTNSYIDTATSTLSTNIETASTSIAAAITAGTASTNATVLTASTSLASNINTNTNSQIQIASSSIVSQILSSITNIPANVWTYISDASRLAVNVWSGASRTLTSAVLGNGSETLATLTDVQTASSSVTSQINSNIDATASVLVGEIQGAWTVTMSDFGETTTLKAYQVKVYVLNSKSVPTDAITPPILTITDAAGTEQKHDVEMTKSSNGVYYYRYTVPSDAIDGVWETEVSTTVEAGKTIKTNDYWSVSSSPADVKIISITDKTLPSITADVEIINKGTSGSDFYYVYCIVDSEDNLCGGNDDIAYKSETVYIDAQKTLNLSLERDVLTPGTYWFKVKARALNETNWAASSEQFVATDSVVVSPVNSPDRGGGGSASVIIPTITAESCNGADFNGDKKVNSVDFSILLAFWQKSYPFKNPCVDINKDKKVNSVEFSILLYEWGKK